MALNPAASAESRRWAPTVCLIGCGAGACVLVVGLLWNSLTSTETFWSPEQAKQYAAAADALHGDRTAGPHTHVEGDDPESKADRARFARMKAELEAARYASDELGPLLAKIGLAAAAAFGIGYLVTRGDSG